MRRTVIGTSVVKSQFALTLARYPVVTAVGSRFVSVPFRAVLLSIWVILFVSVRRRRIYNGLF